MSPWTWRRRSSIDFWPRYVFATWFTSSPACVTASSRLSSHCTLHSGIGRRPRRNSKNTSNAFVAWSCSASPKALRSACRRGWTPLGIAACITAPVSGSNTSSTESRTNALSPMSMWPVGSSCARPRKRPAKKGPTASSGPSYRRYHIFTLSKKDFKGYFGFPGSQPGGTSFRYSSNGIPVWDEPVAIV